MLNLTFTLNGEAGEDTTAQARGVVAALFAIYGDTILPSSTSYTLTHKVGEVLKSSTAPTMAEVIELQHAEEPDAASIMGDGAPETPATAGAEPDRDVHGIPWDARIHSDRGGSTGGKNQDGSWKRKRNTPDDVYAKVMAELKATNTARTMEAATAGGVVPLPPGSADTTTANVPSPPVAAPPASSTVPAPPPAGGNISFPDLMRKVTEAQKLGMFTSDQRADILDKLHINSVTDMIGKQDLLDDFHARFNALMEG